MSSECKKCSLSIGAGENFTVCEGDCAGVFHAECVGLSEEDVLVLSSHSSNIIWLCGECLSRFRRARDNADKRDGLRSPDGGMNSSNAANKKSIEDEVNELKDTVAGIVHTLAKLLPSDSSVDSPMHHSTPVSSFTLQDGNNACSSVVNNDEGLRQQCEDDDNFALLLSNIDTSVAECEIHRMVAQALGSQHPEEIDVVKLVSQWKKRRIMDYISFKVVLDKRWRSKAMDPSTWPKGVKFREFFGRRNDTWKPVGQNLSV